MKKILASILTIAAVAVLGASASRAVFSDTAKVEDNTFATGKLDLRVNGKNEIKGFKYENTAPGVENAVTGQFTLNNYGKPNFDGESTLDIKELVISVQREQNLSGEAIVADSAGHHQREYLYDKLMIKLETNRGWPEKMVAYEGRLSDLHEKDLLSPRWDKLPVSWSQDVYYKVWLPKDTGNEWQGKSAEFNFVIDAFNPRR